MQYEECSASESEIRLLVEVEQRAEPYQDPRPRPKRNTGRNEISTFVSHNFSLLLLPPSFQKKKRAHDDAPIERIRPLALDEHCERLMGQRPHSQPLPGTERALQGFSKRTINMFRSLAAAAAT
jgi:hypothetical protein